MKLRFIAVGLAVLGAAACTGSEPPQDTQAAATALTAAPVLEAFFVVLDRPGAVSAIPASVDPRSPAAAAATRKRVAEIELEQAALVPALEAHGAEVIARISRLANVIQIVTHEEAAERIGRLPGVRKVERAPLVERSLDSAVPVVGAPLVWGGVPGLAGENITIGIIDSGIDYTHADFAGPGTSAAYAANDPVLIEPGTFPTPKVIGGWDFAGDAYNPSAGQTSPNADPDPLDCATVLGEQISGGHGTHVAGIAAGTGVTSDGASFDGPYDEHIYAATFRVGPGVAPRAKLYALKIFGCEGSTTLLASALDRAADPNQDGSFEDRLDVVNASLGTAYGLGSSVVGGMVKELTDVGTLLVAAAGNDGQNFFVTSSPATFPEALSVAASVDSNLLTLRITSPESAVAAYPAAEGDFTARLAAVGAIGAPLVASDPILGCEAFTNAAQIVGSVALIERGTCAFADKLTNAIAAGAVAAVIIDNEDEPLPAVMNGPPSSSPIPGVMVRLDDGVAIQAALAQGPLTIALDPADPYTGPGAELLAGFSSRGPSSIDGRLKPEITAPGAAISSAGVGTGTEPVNNQGTSMASPMVAGAAALVRQARPELSPLEVKAALMNAASSLSDFAGAAYGTGVIGAGRLDVVRAVTSDVVAAADLPGGEVGVSFGAVIATETVTVERTFLLTNRGQSPVTLDATIAPTYVLPGVVVTVSPTKINLPAGQSDPITLTLSFDPEALGGPGPDPGTPAIQGNQTPEPRHFLHQATGLVRFTQAGVGDVVLPYTGSVRAGVDRTGSAPSACDLSDAPDGPIAIELEGTGPHPDPVVTAFQLGGVDDPDPDSRNDRVTAMTDLLAAGVATDLATAPAFEEAQVYFGLAVSGPWSTPARGPVSVVKIQINSDDDPNYEHEIRVEARNPESRFRDALVASAYNLATGERSNRFPINVLRPDVAQTHPFNSTVLVLSAQLVDIGVDSDNPVFDWTARTERPDLVVASDTIKGTFDAAKPAIDTARHGLDGAPVFRGEGPILVDVSPEAESPLDVLLLHHTNVPGKQWQVVTLSQKLSDNLSLTISAPEAESDGSGTAEVTLVVTNGGVAPVPDVKLAGDVNGGEIVSVAPGQGSCATGATLDCELGELAPGASVEVEATVRRLVIDATGPMQVTFEATVGSELPCETDVEDNTASVTIDVSIPSENATGFYPSGGCTCRASGGTPGGAPSSAWLLVAAALGIARRGFRSSSARPAAGESA